MAITPFLLVLAAALLHASWNLLVKASGDRLLMAWMQITFGAAVFLPFLISGGFPTDRIGWVAVSAVVHLIYSLVLTGAYDRGDLSLVYPIARGSAPLLVALGAVLFLDDRPGTVGWVAIGLIVVAIFAMARGRSEGLYWALLTGLAIASYTLIDGAGVRAGDEAFRYTIAVMASDAVLFLPIVLWRRGTARMAAAIRTEGRRSVLGGAASITAYVLVLIAALDAPLGVVAAVRETSVVFGALGGWLLLGEKDGAARLPAAGLIAAGLVLLVI